MTFGLPFLILFHVLFVILENVKYISRLMYFVVLSLQKMIKKRHIFIKNFILFHDSPFYRFFIDFGGARGLRKWPLRARDAPSKKKVPTVKLRWPPRGRSRTLNFISAFWVFGRHASKIVFGTFLDSISLVFGCFLIPLSKISIDFKEVLMH